MASQDGIAQWTNLLDTTVHGANHVGFGDALILVSRLLLYVLSSLAPIVLLRVKFFPCLKHDPLLDIYILFRKGIIVELGRVTTIGSLSK